MKQPPQAPQPLHPEQPPQAEDRIRRQARRLDKARRRSGFSPLHGLGALGVIGWSVALPTVGGALLGIWLDKISPRDFSWTIALMLGGLAIGVIVAAEWVTKQGKALKEEDDDV